MTNNPSISIVIPTYNEENSVHELFSQILETKKKNKFDIREVIFIDDGSEDDTSLKLEELRESYELVKVITFRRNLGKSYALQKGFEEADSDLIVTMDADLQDIPSELPNFLSKLDNGSDLVSGWKKVRNDPVTKTFPSKIFNWIIRIIFNVKLHDINCGYKLYKKEVAKQLVLYGELHRFVPILVSHYGFKITEVAIKHNPRKFGNSKYGISRFLKGLIDLTSVFFITRFTARPNHLFGTVGVMIGILGGIGLSYLFVIWLVGIRPIGDRPLFLFSVFLVLTSIQLFSLGLISELINQNSERESIDKFIIKKN